MAIIGHGFVSMSLVSLLKLMALFKTMLNVLTTSCNRSGTGMGRLVTKRKCFVVGFFFVVVLSLFHLVFNVTRSHGFGTFYTFFVNAV